jgi:DNA polymerase III subunit beta
MRFGAQREALLRPLQQVIGVVERRQTLPVLANLMIEVRDSEASFTGTDLEVELRARMQVEDAESGELTVPARKLFDICRALPDGTRVELRQSAERVALHAGKSRYTLTTLPAADFPTVEFPEAVERYSVAQAELKRLLERTAFAMANQDVRYYLNGLLLEARPEGLRAVATDGHRLALCDAPLISAVPERRQFIVPRKGVLELQRLLDAGGETVEIELGRNHVRVRLGETQFTSKLIDGRFPDYEAVIPIGADREVHANRDELRSALQRAAILSNEKYRGVKLEVSPGRIKIVAHNPEQEEAVEEIAANTEVNGLGIGFNVNYLLDALSALDGEDVVICLRDGNSSALVRQPEGTATRHVVMPLRL